MERIKVLLKNSVILSPATIRDQVLSQIEDNLTDQEIMLAFNDLEKASSNGAQHRISSFTWRDNIFSVKLELGITHY